MSAGRRRPRPRSQSAKPSSGTAPTFARNRLAWAAVLVPLLLGAFVYVRTATFDFSFLDDAFLKDREPFFSNLGNIPRAFRSLYVLGTYYRPLVTVSYIVDAQWSGASPLPYHVTNVLLHLLATALLYLLLMRFRFSPGVSGFAASLFAIHPALVETVAWIPGRNDLLLGVFALGAWVLLTLYVERPSIPRLLAHGACLLAALFTKETAVTLPLLFAVSLWAVERARPMLRSKGLWSTWVLSVGGYVAARAAVVSSSPGTAHELPYALLQQGPALLSSLGKLCLPMQLSPLATARDTSVWPGVAATAVIAISIVASRLERRRVLLLAASTFLLPLLPTAFVAQRLVLENRLYVPAVGLSLFIAEISAAVSPSRPRVLAIVGACILVVLFPLSWVYAGAYRNRETVAEAATTSSPSSALAHLQRGDAYYTVHHDLDSAEAEYRRAIEIDPRELVVHNNLAVVLMARGQVHDAEGELRKELENNPQYAPAHYNLGIVLRGTGRADEAAAEWTRTLQSDPNHINAMGELLVYYAARGELAKAAYYREQMAQRGLKFVTPPRADP